MGVEITTQRLRLRPLVAADAPRIRALAGDLAVARWLARVPHPYPDGEAERFISACLAEGASVRAIERLAEPGLIGVVGIEGEPKREVLGYWIGRPFWGLGYASEAASAVVDWTFAALGLDGLRSGVFEGNEGSMRVQRKLGFAVTGRRMIACRALGIDRPHIDTALPRGVWEARA
jgi:[ribosomal protein S5]-alanine N-acetyltransferase